jgi:hypothetical protein
LILQTADIYITWADGSRNVKLSAISQIGVGSFIGLHYYVTVFNRATQGLEPQTSWAAYALYSMAFMALCLVARIRHGKKWYGDVEDEGTCKKN